MGKAHYLFGNKKMLSYIDDNDIGYKEISSFFPATPQGQFIELNADARNFAELDLDKNKYVIFSNIANWDDNTIDEVTQHWILQKEFQKNRVFIKIYRNPKIEK